MVTKRLDFQITGSLVNPEGFHFSSEVTGFILLEVSAKFVYSAGWLQIFQRWVKFLQNYAGKGVSAHPRDLEDCWESDARAMDTTFPYTDTKCMDSYFGAEEEPSPSLTRTHMSHQRGQQLAESDFAQLVPEAAIISAANSTKITEITSSKVLYLCLIV